MSKLQKILSVVSLATLVLLIGLVSVALAHQTPASKNHQLEASTNGPANTEPSNVPSQNTNVANTQPTVSVASTQVQSAQTPAQPVVVANTDTLTSIPNHSPDTGILSGHIYYDANGNACGIGPTGICLLPVVKSFEVRDSTNNLVVVVTSDTSGAFKATLQPGTYTIIPEPGSGVNPSAERQTITVSKTHYETITITYAAIAVTNTVIVN